MGDSWNIIGWVIIALGVLAGAVVLWVIFKAHIDQWLANRKRRRADAGKVKCEHIAWFDGGTTTTKDCDEIAIYVTPNGYSCEFHEGVMSTKKHLYGSTMWAHPLNHTLKGKV